MLKTTLRVDGMMCAMCESHVNYAIRSAFAVKKVSSSHKKGICTILSDTPLDETALRAAVGKTGYRILSFVSEPYKKGLFG